MQIQYNIDNFKFKGQYTLNNYKGCLKGGAIGDALGWPIEFQDIGNIKKQYGQNGIEDLLILTNKKAEITDDTQMTMFTADGILKSLRQTLSLDKIPNLNTIFDSYKLWFNTQRFIPIQQKNKGWISELKDLYAIRAPGSTCISAIKKNIPGSIENPINNSSGCGGVMRVAPVGLMYKDNEELAFEVGARCAALTHGNPQAYLSAGFLSGMIANIINGNNVHNAVDNTIKYLKKYNNHESTLNLINKAKELSKSNIEPINAIEELGPKTPSRVLRSTCMC